MIRLTLMKGIFRMVTLNQFEKMLRYPTHKNKLYDNQKSHYPI